MNRKYKGEIKNESPYNKTESVDYYISKIRDINQEKINETGSPPLVSCVTFGCQMNAHDSEKLIGMLGEMLYKETEEEKEADVIIYNTCCVRENAENKVYGNLGYLKSLKEKKRDLKIILCGCMMQQNTVIEKIRKSYRHVDIIFGTYNLYKLPELMYTNIESGGQVIDVWDKHGEIVEDLPSKRGDKFRAGVNITYGCDNYCSYCIVPYVRGRERSREAEDILNEIRNLAADGVKEITLLGQNVNSYGKGTNITFAELLHMAHNIQGIERIRFMTSHPKDLSDELIDAVAKLRKVCNHVHLPVQSGSSNILKRMNRKYTKEDYLTLADKLKKRIPGVSITTDIIVGFPGETEEDFLDTLDVVRKVRFSGAFTFIYSKRVGTPAAMMEGAVDETVVSGRFDRLVKEINSGIYEINKSFVGKTVKTLAVELQATGLLSGRTEGNQIVHFKGSPTDISSIVDVKITDCKTFYMVGEKHDSDDGAVF